MKNIFIGIALLLISLLSTAQQPLVGALNSTVSISPSYTLTNNSSFSLNGSVVNIGTVTINSDVHVNLAIDTSTTGNPKYFWRKTVSYPVTNFSPNQSFNFSINDVASNTNGYKIAGNGTTVVVWFAVGVPNDSLSCIDSVFTNVYILPISQGIDELNQLKKDLIRLSNPVTNNIQFINSEKWTIELVSMDGAVHPIKDLELKVRDYSNGLYLLRFRNGQGDKISKKIIIQ